MNINSKAEIQKRIAAGKITWAGPLIMLAARPVFLLIGQALVAAIFYRGNDYALVEAGQWFRVFGTLVDVGRERWPRDVLIGLGLTIPFILLTMVPVMAIPMLIGYIPPAASGLPMVATLYSLVIWPVIWVFAEDNTYLGYGLARVEALSGRKWLAVVVMGFFMMLHHVLVPFGSLEWQHLVTWIVGFTPFIIFYCWLYFRMRRLLPIMVAHYLLDVFSLLALTFLIPR
jgi:membrane protease YdiL (CAAX protease family)